MNMRNLIVRVENMHGLERQETAETSDGDTELDDLSGWKM
jgi:hypothetical protein